MIGILTIVKKEWKYLLFILLVLIVFFHKTLLFGEIFFTGDFLRSDTLHQNLPFKYTLFQSLKNGQLPFWTDKIFNGYPLLAEGQIGVFYPFNFVLYLLFPFVFAYNFSQFFNFLCAAWGMFFLVKSFRLSSFSSLISAIVFSLSGFFVFHITHQNIVSTACWLPLLWLLFKLFFEKKEKKYAIFSSLIIAIQIFAGSFQITFYSQVITLLFLMFYLYKKQSLAEVILKYLGIVFLAFLFSAIQLVPSLILLFDSTRQTGIGNLALDSLPYHPRNLITFIFPFIFGDPGEGTYPRFGGSWGMFWENTGYLGIVSFFIALSTLLHINKKEIKIFWLIIFISVLLALGKYGPLFFVYYLPGFSFFRVTGRFLLFVVFGLSVLTGFGVDNWMKQIKNNLYKSLFGFGLLFIIVIDLFIFGYFYNPTVKAERVLEKPEMVKFLDQYPQKGKVFSVADFLTYDEINKNGWRKNIEDNLFHKNSLGPDLNMLWGYKTIDGYAGLFPKEYEEVKTKIYQGLNMQGNKIVISQDVVALFKNTQTRFLISAYDLEGKDLKKIFEVSNGKIIYKLYQVY